MSRGLRALLAGLVTLGVCGFIVGLVGDLKHWWDGLGYTSNVLAGLTGACFGIPFAVLVLQNVLQQDRSRTQRLQLVRRIRRHLSDMKLALLDIIGPVAPPEPARDWDHLDDTLSSLQELATQILGSGSDWQAPMLKIPHLSQDVSIENRHLQEAVERLFNGDAYEGSQTRLVAWLTMQNRWRMLAEELLPAAEEELGLRADTTVFHTIEHYVQRFNDYGIYHPLRCVVDFSKSLDELVERLARDDLKHEFDKAGLIGVPLDRDTWIRILELAQGSLVRMRGTAKEVLAY